MSETRELQFFIPAEEVENLVSEGLKRKRQTVTLKGFRRGQVPLELIKQMYYQELYDSVTRQKLIDQLEKYRLENKILAIIPEDVEYGVDADQLKCIVRAKLVRGLELDVVAAAMAEQPIKAKRLILPTQEEVEFLQKVEEEILRANFVPSSEPLRENGGLVVNVVGSKNSFPVLAWSFDEEARELIRANIGKKAGDKIILELNKEESSEGSQKSEEVNAARYSIEVVIAEVLERKTRDLSEDVATTFRDRLSARLDDINKRFRRSSAFLFFVNRFITDEVCDQVRSSGILGSGYSEVAVADLFLLNIFEQAGLEVKEDELRGAVIENYSTALQNGVQLAQNDMRYLVDSTLSALKVTKAMDLLSEKAQFEFEDEVCDLNRFLELLSVPTFKFYKDRFLLSTDTESDNNDNTSAESL